MFATVAARSGQKRCAGQEGRYGRCNAKKRGGGPRHCIRLSPSAFRRAVPGADTALSSGDPSAWRGDTSVASMASGITLFAGSPVATISIRLLSAGSMFGSVVSRRYTFSRRRMPASRRIRIQICSIGRERSRSRPGGGERPADTSAQGVLQSFWSERVCRLGRYGA